MAHRHVRFSWQVHLITSKFGSFVSLEKSDDLALLGPIPAWQRSGGAEGQLRRQKAFPTLPRASVSRSWPVSFIYFTCLAPRALNLQPVFERKHLPKPHHRKRKKKAELLWLEEELTSGLSPALPWASPRTSGLSGTQRETPGSRSLQSAALSEDRVRRHEIPVSPDLSLSLSQLFEKSNCMLLPGS